MNGRTVVVGAGISGLVAARELCRAGAEDVILMESSERLGGKINRINLPSTGSGGSPSTGSGGAPSAGSGGGPSAGSGGGPSTGSGGAPSAGSGGGPSTGSGGSPSAGSGGGPSTSSGGGPSTSPSTGSGSFDRLRTSHSPGSGVLLDSGAESLLIRRPEALELINELGLDDRLTYPTGAKASVLVDGRMRSLPPTVMGIPTDLDALSDHLSPAGLQRARQEPDVPAPPVGSDVGIGAYVDQRFGPEVTDRLLEPMLGGVYAGDSRQLSFEAVHPTLFDAIRQGGSLLAHAQETARTARRDDRQPQPPAMAGLTGGVGTLIEALGDDLRRRGGTIRTNATVRAISRLPDGRFELTGGPVPRPEVLTADWVLLATPATATARLTGTLAPAAAEELSAMSYASTALVVAVLADADIAGSGVLVPRGELGTIKAFTHSANKWSWVADDCRNAFGGATTAVRISIGRHGDEQQLHIPDRQLIERTLDEARQVPGLADARVVRAAVQRWGGGLPQYAIGHRDRVARLREAIGAVEGLEIAGAYLDGLGVPACIATARQAAASLLG